MKGILFRKIDNEDQLIKYHERIPVEYIVQDLVELPVEVSVFYYRHPTQQKGTVSGFINKELLQVKGDGHSTLKQLIEQHPAPNTGWKKWNTVTDIGLTVLSMMERYFTCPMPQSQPGCAFYQPVQRDR
jgi:hypothetical protein